MTTEAARIRVETARAIADDIDASAEAIYPKGIWPEPSAADYAEINALLQRERGHMLDAIAADCMRRAIHATARTVRAAADDAAIDDAEDGA